jgi:hypothetical protein
MHRNPLKRAKPVRSSAAATPGANLPQGLGKEQRPGLQHGDGKEQATTCEVAVRSMYFVVEEGLLKRLGAGNRKYPGPQALRRVTCRAHAQRHRVCCSTSHLNLPLTTDQPGTHLHTRTSTYVCDSLGLLIGAHRKCHACQPWRYRPYLPSDFRIVIVVRRLQAA